MESGIVKSGTGVETAVVENAQVYVFSKAEYQVDSGNRTFKVIFSAADEINRVIRQHLANRAGKHPEALLYDAEELKERNETTLYVTDPSTGVILEGLSRDARSLFSPLNTPPVYDEPLTDKEIEERVAGFAGDIVKILSADSLPGLVGCVPRKKDGSLCSGRITLILKDRISDVQGKVCVLYARNLSDTELELRVKTVYLGDKLYGEAEGARTAGILKSLEQEKKEKKAEAKAAKEKALKGDPFGYSLKGHSPYRSDPGFNKQYEQYFSKDPVIEFNGKNFVFSSMFEKNEMMEQPIVKAVMDRGGAVRQDVSGKTDYLVAESIKTVNENHMRKAVEQIEKGKGLQIITAEDLIEALKKA